MRVAFGVLYNDLDHDIDVVLKTSQLIHLRFTLKTDDGNVWFLSGVYASPRYAKREDLWDTMISLAASSLESWTCIGDFNSYLSVDEKSGGGAPNFRAMAKFQECVQD